MAALPAGMSAEEHPSRPLRAAPVEASELDEKTIADLAEGMKT